MEINYTEFNKWINWNDQLLNASPISVLGEENLFNYINGKKPTYTESEIILIDQNIDIISNFSEKYLMFTNEIKKNIINIGEPNKINQYLTYLYEEHSSSFANLKIHLNYYWIKTSKIIFDEIEEVSINDNHPFEENKFRDLTLHEKLLSVEKGWGIAFDLEGNIQHYSRMLHQDPASKYLDAVMSFIFLYHQSGGDIKKFTKLKKSNKDVFEDITLKDIFYSQYTKDYQSFFDILKEKQYGFIDSDNCWETEAHAFQYFKELQSDNFKVIRTKYGANKKVITDKLVGELFKDYFGLKPHNFTSKLPILPENEIKFRKAIQSVKSKLD